MEKVLDWLDYDLDLRGPITGSCSAECRLIWATLIASAVWPSPIS